MWAQGGLQNKQGVSSARIRERICCDLGKIPCVVGGEKVWTADVRYQVSVSSTSKGLLHCHRPLQHPNQMRRRCGNQAVWESGNLRGGRGNGAVREKERQPGPSVSPQMESQQPPGLE
ncbi:Delta-1-pyrroline-5-carboxylate dehydrogenase, mitochondrial, partial [Ophiophagus hannah]